MLRLNKYINFVQTVNPVYLVFTDEKPYKTKNIFEGQVRRDPRTGYTPHVSADTDNLRNSFNIMAAIRCSGSPTENIFYQMGKFSGNSFMFREFVVKMIETKFLRPGDILVCDTATIHTSGE